MKTCLVSVCLFLGFFGDDISSAVLGTLSYDNRSYNRPNSMSSCRSPSLKNGKIRRRGRGRVVKFICNPGYLLAGDKYSTCNSGQWDTLLPRCVRPTCMRKVAAPINGIIHPSHNGAAIHFFCNPGYELSGPSDVYCDGSKWNENPPSCIQNNTKPQLFCDFESEDICGWTHDLNHDFDWTRNNYQTPSGHIKTGPSFDHTKGRDQDGFYMYIESSSKNVNDTARLISPIFEKTTNDTCLEFFYHMYGATTGTLRVFVKRTSEDWSLWNSRLVFSKSGDQGDKWYRSYHSLGPISENYQIVIEGIRGPGYVSDIAVDDVRIIENCVYEDDAFSTTTEVLYSTEALLTVESCENRCGFKAIVNESHYIPCDCDVTCYDNSTCCPDYLDLCLLRTTTEEYYSTTDIPNEIAPPESTAVVIDSLPPRTTSHPKIYSQTPTTASITTTLSTTSRITTTKPRFIPKYPTVKLLKPPTTPTIVRKVLTTVAPTKVIKVKPTSRRQATNDVEEMPRRTDDDKIIIVTPQFHEDVYKEKDDIEYKSRNIGESDKLASKINPEGEAGGHKLAFVLIGLIGVGVLTTVIVIFVVRRYKGSGRRMNSSNGDSQSDVRFLTNDEVLDFSLDRDYDEL